MENIKAGDMLAGTWGATMVIPAFFKVVKVTEKRVKLLEYDGKMTDGDGFQGYEEPDFTKVRSECIGIPVGNGYIRVKIGIGSHVLASKWDGKPVWADYMD